jgi:hypothetical protein
MSIGWDCSIARIVGAVDGRVIRDAVLEAVEETPASGELPAIYQVVNEISLRAVTRLAEREGWREGVALAASRRAMLVAVAAVARTLEDSLDQRVEDLRVEGVTWTEIGQLLGLTREGAARRFDPDAREKALEAGRRSRAKRQTASASADTPHTVASARRKPRSSNSK